MIKDENLEYVYVKTSEREKQWKEFSDTVANHLREYTVPQYGDVGEDEITNYTVEQCVEHIKRYAKRYGSQSRDGQQELDFMKIAHYAQCAWEKYGNMKEEPVSGEACELFFSYGVVEDNNLVAKGFQFVGVGLDSEGTEVHVFKKGDSK